jgi:hypothetical protein
VGEEQKGGRNAEATQSRKGTTSTEPTEESVEKHESIAGHMTLQDKMGLVRKKGSVEGIEFSEKEWKLVNNRFTQTALPKANAEVQQHFILNIILLLDLQQSPSWISCGLFSLRVQLAGQGHVERRQQPHLA